MKALLKRPLRALWRGLAPVRRPLSRKFDDRVRGLVAETVQPLIVAELERRVHPALDATTAIVRENIDRTEDIIKSLRRSAQENTLLLDSLVRELVRVQVQLELLQQHVPDQDPDQDQDQDQRQDRSHRRDPADPFAPFGATSAAERLMIG